MTRAYQNSWLTRECTRICCFGEAANHGLCSIETDVFQCPSVKIWPVARVSPRYCDCCGIIRQWPMYLGGNSILQALYSSTWITRPFGVAPVDAAPIIVSEDNFASALFYENAE